MAGLFRNFVDVLGGEFYETKGLAIIFGYKPIGIIVTSEDRETAEVGAAQAKQIVLSTGPANLPEWKPRSYLPTSVT